MNIVWFTWKDRSHPLAGGAETVNEQLAARLARAGHTVTFVVGGFRGAAPVEGRLGFRIVRVGGRYTTYLAAAVYYGRHHRQLDAGLVIDECNTIPYFAGWYTGRPTVMLFHMLCRRIWFYEFPQPFSTIGFLLEPIYLRLLRRGPVISLSNSTTADLRRQGFAARRIHLISEGIDFPPIPDLASVTKYTRPTLLGLGAMRPMKRTLDQIKAFELAKPRLPGLQLILAGDSSGRYGQRVLAAIRRSPYAGDIHYKGRVTPAQKLTLLRKSHLLLATSVKEGWGLTITEAASQGTPAVAYNADGLRDSIRHGKTGFLTPANTPDALAATTLRLLTSPKRYAAVRHAAWQHSHHITFDRGYRDFTRALGLPPTKR